MAAANIREYERVSVVNIHLDERNQITFFDECDKFEHTYDGGGLLARKEYAYTTGELGGVMNTVSYGYSGSWKDLLTSYNGTAISYDTIGNPLTWRGGLSFISIHKIETVENRVREIFNDHILEPEQITGEELFSKVNSVDYIKIIVAIELEYDFEFNDDDLSIGRFKTITELSQYIMTRLSEQD